MGFRIVCHLSVFPNAEPHRLDVVVSARFLLGDALVLRVLPSLEPFSSGVLARARFEGVGVWAEYDEVTNFGPKLLWRAPSVSSFEDRPSVHTSTD